jgi:hypothetical protein
MDRRPMAERPEEGPRGFSDEYEVHHADIFDCPAAGPGRRRWLWWIGAGGVILLVGCGFAWVLGQS